MLTYEYGCMKCKHRFEMVQGMNHLAPLLCPSCGEEGAIEAIIHGGSGFVLRGSNWAKDGYAATPASLGKTEEKP